MSPGKGLLARDCNIEYIKYLRVANKGRQGRGFSLEIATHRHPAPRCCPPRSQGIGFSLEIATTRACDLWEEEEGSQGIGFSLEIATQKAQPARRPSISSQGIGFSLEIATTVDSATPPRITVARGSASRLRLQHMRGLWGENHRRGSQGIGFSLEIATYLKLLQANHARSSQGSGFSLEIATHTTGERGKS